MVIAGPVRAVIGVSGKFPSADGQVVAARPLGGDAEGAHGLQYDLGLLFDVKIGAGHEEGEVEVSEVVEHRAAAGEAAGKLPAVRFELRHAALAPAVLVASHDDCLLVLPEIEDAFVRLDQSQQILLKSEVLAGIGPGGKNAAEFFDHAFVSCQRMTGWRAASTSSGRPMTAWCGLWRSVSGSVSAVFLI